MTSHDSLSVSFRHLSCNYPTSGIIRMLSSSPQSPPLQCRKGFNRIQHHITSYQFISYHIVSYHIISHDNSVATLGVLTVIVQGWFYFEVVSYVRAGFECFWWLLQRKSSFIFCFRRKSRTKRCPRRPLFRRSRFTSAPCSLFELCPFCVAGVAPLGHFEV